MGTVELEPEVPDWLESLSTPQFALTVFAKTRMREAGEVERARRAMARCMAQEHTVEDDDG